MKFLFDQNLSPRLVARLEDEFPGSQHVASLGLSTANDRAIWDFAALNGFSIVTKDVDFGDLSILLGSPPKIVWIQLGNCSTDDIETLLRTRKEQIAEFVLEENLRVLRLE